MKIGLLTLPTFSSPAKIGVVVALVLALSASGAPARIPAILRRPLH